MRRLRCIAILSIPCTKGTALNHAVPIIRSELSWTPSRGLLLVPQPRDSQNSLPPSDATRTTATTAADAVITQTLTPATARRYRPGALPGTSLPASHP